MIDCPMCNREMQNLGTITKFEPIIALCEACDIEWRDPIWIVCTLAFKYKEYTDEEMKRLVKLKAFL